MTSGSRRGEDDGMRRETYRSHECERVGCGEPGVGGRYGLKDASVRPTSCVGICVAESRRECDQSISRRSAKAMKRTQRIVRVNVGSLFHVGLLLQGESCEAHRALAPWRQTSRNLQMPPYPGAARAYTEQCDDAILIILRYWSKNCTGCRQANNAVVHVSFTRRRSVSSFQLFRGPRYTLYKL